MAGLTCLVIGPPILLLAPVWFIGVGAYYITRSIDGSLGFGLLLFAGSIVAFLMLDVFDIPQSLQTWTDARLGETGVAMLRQSRFVLTDYAISRMEHLLHIARLADLNCCNGLCRDRGST